MQHEAAEVVELVDALDSKSSEGDLVRVRFPPSVQGSSSESEKIKGFQQKC